MRYLGFLLYGLSIFFSLHAQANCSALKTSENFTVLFRINDANLDETVFISKKNGKSSYPLWSDDWFYRYSSIIYDSISVEKGKDYDIWLHYESGGHKAGVLTYYQYIAPAGWTYVTHKDVNLSFLRSINIGISEENTDQLICSSGGEGPELPEPEPDYCELFPGPVQTWQGNTNNYFSQDATSQIFNTSEKKVGFSNQITKSYNPLYAPSAFVSGLCDGMRCELDGPQSEEKALRWDTSTVEHIKIDHVVKKNEISKPNTQYESYWGAPYPGLQVERNASLTFTSGEYWVDSAIILGKLNIDGNVVLHVWNKLDIGGSVNTSNPTDNLTIFAYNSGGSCPLPANFPKGPPQVNTSYAVNINVAGQFNGRIYSQGPVALSNATTLIGAVTACQLQLSNTAKIIGKSECFDPQPKNTLKITPKSAFGLTCERMPVTFSVRKENGDLDTDYSGTLNASVTSSNPTNSCWALTEDATECSKENITISLPGGQRKLWLQSKTAGDITIKGKTGDLSDNAGPYRFAPFGFRVNGGDPAKTVAGKNETLLIEAVADRGAKCEVIEDYGKVEGENKPLSITSLDYVQPTTGSKSLDVDGSTLADGASIVKSLRFTQGKALLPVTYKDAGEISFELADDKWQPKDCETDSTDCDDRERDWKGLKGKAVIYSRPYTFALCDIQSAGGRTDFSGTSSSGNGFAAAGETFSVTFKPIIWTSSLANPDSDNSSDSNHDIVTTGSAWCQVATTPNYYSVEALNLSAPLNLSIPDAPHSPVPEQGTANKGELAGTVSVPFNQRQAQDGLIVSNLTWSEVGSLWLQSDATYLGMKLDQGVGALGRFYPHHFTLNSSELVDAVPDKFTYMDQSFTASFEVEAQNKAGGATLNYGDFAAVYQEKLDLVAIDGGVTSTDKNELTSRLDQSVLPSLPPWAKSWSQATLTLDQGEVGFLRDVITSEPKTTSPDGPYDVRVGLVVNKPADCATRGCTDFADQDLELLDADDVTSVKAIALAGNITARYGRLKLDDANSQFDKAVNVSVRAQYWDSSVNAFVINTDDSISRFDGGNYCKQMIWPTAPDDVAKSKSIMQGSGTVSSGKSYVLEASPDRTDYFREQVRFWLRLAKSPQSTESGVLNCKDGDAPTAGDYYRPWLQYNWRDNGDEDPSAVVTFGVYRGNDRIIYRGEKGMNRLLN
ncbi:DUF6701 domain-containing protein [Photobacterium lipolyticum]|uniref:MSHA biogenesis protein MshQ n=1 Tax=Photobacterium lipolyticum TaxID=266810 RepID=A0A2T3MXX7_9GAMM|nr:DUF6701 domain-containing protein [Photobacterium lipolyticum]PSW04730.1 MSHA biogenesis protein MshQ [Photobacterium lipolyticum]